MPALARAGRRGVIKRGMILAAVAMASACAPTVRLPRPQVALPEKFEVDAGTRPSPAVIERWWTSFGDKQLTTLVDKALARSTDVRLSFAELREARASRRSAFAGTLPTGTVNATATRQYTTRLASNVPSINLGGTLPTGDDGSLADLFNPNGAIDSFNVAASPSWEIDLFGRLSATRAEARSMFAASYLDFEAVRLSVAADVATTYFEAKGYAAELENARETLRISRALAQSARLGAERGIVAGSDVDRLETDVATAEADAERAANALNISKRSLQILTGDVLAPLDALAINSVLPASPAVPTTTPAELLERRPDVRAAQARLFASTSRIDIDRAGLFPRVTLQPGATLSGTNSPLGATNLIWQIGGGIALPILNRPALIAQLRISQARGEQSVVRYERVVQTAFQEADRALRGVVTDRRRQAALERAAASSERAFDAKQIGFRLGLNDLTTLLQAETAYRTARNALTAQRTASLQNTVTAFKALGGGWTPARDAGAAGAVLTDNRDHQ